MSSSPVWVPMGTDEHPEPWIKTICRRASRAHSRVPEVTRMSELTLKKMRSVADNLGNRGLMSTAALAYILGLRHALDADHISAIDLMTRRLLASGQKPVSVGMFFSLGHSTIVIVTSIVVAATAAAVSKNFDNFSHIGGIIGSSVSAAFLLILGIMNIYILAKLIQQLRLLLRTPPGQEVAFKIEGGGVLFNLFQKMFRLIDRPWKMYPLGVLFGLGFDTSSEIALLGISSIQSAKGTSLWLILFFPLLFTAGMCLLDTTDGALMMSLYSSTTLARDQISVCYYSVCLTAITVVVAMFIGVVQLLILGSNLVSEKEGEKGFWKGVAVLGERYDIVGGSICGAFVFFGILSVLLYRPWRRKVDSRRSHLIVVDEEPVEDDETHPSGAEVMAGTSSSAIRKAEAITIQVDGKK
ncbi:hypothetical protein EG328_002311 [Venturia inaequalis]|uniref:Nickel/cobalt efflux system n=1 Tax=Venturia inaequalis TaxID=5025 RepID=A0A8H3UYB2_VENIN|nr:hypothetical protein EG328_002311 [Venturia inaequalis]